MIFTIYPHTWKRSVLHVQLSKEQTVWDYISYHFYTLLYSLWRWVFRKREREREREREWHSQAKSRARKRLAISKLVSPKTTSSLKSTFFLFSLSLSIYIYIYSYLYSLRSVWLLRKSKNITAKFWKISDAVIRLVSLVLRVRNLFIFFSFPTFSQQAS